MALLTLDSPLQPPSWHRGVVSEATSGPKIYLPCHLRIGRVSACPQSETLPCADATQHRYTPFPSNSSSSSFSLCDNPVLVGSTKLERTLVETKQRLALLGPIITSEQLCLFSCCCCSPCGGFLRLGSSRCSFESAALIFVHDTCTWCGREDSPPPRLLHGATGRISLVISGSLVIFHMNDLLHSAADHV